MPQPSAPTTPDTPTDDLDELIGSKAACRILNGIHHATLSRWVASGRIKPAGKMAGRTGAFVFRRSDVERLATELATAATP